MKKLFEKHQKVKKLLQRELVVMFNPQSYIIIISIAMLLFPLLTLSPLSAAPAALAGGIYMLFRRFYDVKGGNIEILLSGNVSRREIVNSNMIFDILWQSIFILQFVIYRTIADATMDDMSITMLMTTGVILIFTVVNIVNYSFRFINPCIRKRVVMTAVMTITLVILVAIMFGMGYIVFETASGNGRAIIKERWIHAVILVSSIVLYIITNISAYFIAQKLIVRTDV